jgi:uncharacterized membrane protein
LTPLDIGIFLVFGWSAVVAGLAVYLVIKLLIDRRHKQLRQNCIFNLAVVTIGGLLAMLLLVGRYDLTEAVNLFTRIPQLRPNLVLSLR